MAKAQYVYGPDMPFLFKKPEYADFREVFLFPGQQRPGTAFRASAKEVVWCDVDKLIQDDFNC